MEHQKQQLDQQNERIDKLERLCNEKNEQVNKLQELVHQLATDRESEQNISQLSKNQARAAQDL